MIRILIVFLIAATCHAQGNGEDKPDVSTNNPPVKVEKEKEKKLEHFQDKIVMKARDKGSKKESDFKVDKEYRLMFNNNPKARKPKDKKPK